ncbi:MAG: fructose-1,6-bisphosphatase [Dehalococcoidia bacterium]|nr:fructose-1,6-bisphosphatase [Dehalococcoidia bacterium]
MIKADVGGLVGHSAMHPDVLDAGREALARAVQSGLLIDGHASHCGDDLFLIMSHDRGEDDEAVHRLAWETFVVGTDVAKRLHLYGAGQDLLVDAFPGNVQGAGPGSVELGLEERPSEPVVVFMAGGTAAGVFNLPLYKMFADPFNTAGLVIAEPMHDGFSFEVHDVRASKKIMLATPAESYDLLSFIGSPSRYAVKRVVTRNGEVVAASSTDKISLIAGRHAGNDDPAAIVRCQGDFPVVGEVLEPFATAWTVEGAMRGSHYGPLMPVALDQAQPSRFSGPPRVVALGFQLAEGKLVGPRDMFDDSSFDNARSEANQVADYLRKHGPFEPHRLPLDEAESPAMPGVAAKLASRWADLG